MADFGAKNMVKKMVEVECINHKDESSHDIATVAQFRELAITYLTNIVKPFKNSVFIDSNT